MAKSALVMGGTGFLGSAITNKLLQEGWTTDVMSRKQPADTSGFTWLQADRLEPEQLHAALAGKSYELVVDCSGYTGASVTTALHATEGRCGHYVFISTDYVYASTSESTYPLTESAAVQRDTPYAIGKLDAEAVLLEAWERRKQPVTILRPPHILGAGKELGSDQVLGRDKKLLAKIRSGEGVRLLNEGKLIIQPVWNREIAACIAHLAGMEAGFGQVFNCTGPEAVTAERYYSLVAGLLGVPLRFDSVPVSQFIAERPGDRHYARHRLYDLGHLTRTTGYTPQFKLADALEETLRWMLRDEA